MISVIVVNYNAGSLLTDCIRSVIAQADEIVVVDNASSDKSLETCINRFPDNPQLKIIRNNNNLGFAKACNIGVLNSKGDYLLFLNPDCQMNQGSVDALKDVIIQEDSTGMVGGLLINPDGSEQGGGRRAIPTPWRSFVRAFGLSRLSSRWPELFQDYHLEKQPLPDFPVEVEAISGACMMVKREAVEDVGLWDEDYFLHCEDLDWCMRFRQKGWKILFVPKAKVTHVLSACSRSRPYFVEWHKHKGMLRFYQKFFRHHYSGILWFLVVIGVWFRYALVVGYHFIKRIGQALTLR